MLLSSILKDKSRKSKEKVEMISNALLDHSILLEDVLTLSVNVKDPDLGTCMESLEFATRQAPKLANEKLLKLATQTLANKAPRVKWESAKVIGNIAHLFPKKLDDAIGQLLVNTEDKGTVVRWAAAFALGEIIKLKTSRNKELIPAIENIIAREENNGVKKKYLEAIKAINKT